MGASKATTQQRGAGEASGATQTITAAEYNALPKRGRNKFGAKKVVIDNIAFASRAEGRRYLALKLLMQAGQITDLDVHPVYHLEVNGMLIGRYTPDFCYRLSDGTLTVEDVKGGRATKTEAYGLRKKLMKAIFGLDIQEVAA